MAIPLSPNAVARARGIGIDDAKLLSDRLASRDNWSDVLVCMLDIRKSTAVMLNTEDFEGHAKALAEFNSFVRHVTQQSGGWFDKFTGDGAVVFWDFEKPDPVRITKALEAMLTFQMAFNNATVARVRVVAGCIPVSFGLAVGADYERCLLSDMSIQDELEIETIRLTGEVPKVQSVGNVKPQSDPSVTVLGRPVVGAARMLSAASAHEVLLNQRLGEFARPIVLEDPTKQSNLDVVEVRNKDLGSDQYAFRLGHPALLRYVADRMSDSLRQINAVSAIS